MSASPDKENRPASDSDRLEQEARSLYEIGDFQASLKSLQRAYQINPTSRLERRIERLLNVINSTKHSDIDSLIKKTTNLSIQEKTQSDERLTVESLLSEARILFEQGNTEDSLAKIKEAYAIDPNRKILRKLERLEEVLENERKLALVAAVEEQSNNTNSASIQETSNSTRESTTRSTSIRSSVKSKSSLTSSQRQIDVSPTKSVEGPSRTSFEEEPSGVNNFSSKKLTEGRVSGIAEPKSSETPPQEVATSENAEAEAREHIKQARALMEEGRLQECLDELTCAYIIDSNPKTARKIERIQAMITSSTQQSIPKPFTSAQSAESNSEESARLEKQARVLFRDKDYHGTLDLLLKANKLCPNEKLKRRIGRLRELMAEEDKRKHQEDDAEDDVDALIRGAANLSITEEKFSPGANMTKVSDGFYLPTGLYERLYPYQVAGVAWLWNLHKTAPGGILADDMGLGKTLQTIAFLTGLFLCDDEGGAKRKKPLTAIILAPVSVMQTWQSEFEKWSPYLRLYIYYEMTKKARQQALINFQSRGGILLTSYNMFTSGAEEIASCQSVESTGWLSSNCERYYRQTFAYDYVILDEAHRIKNPSAKISQAVRLLDCKHRLLITGTAIQNNLRELWSLFDFTHAGRLLGGQQTFMLQYGKPILRSRERDASNAERLHGNLMADSLNKLIAPFILRRTKQDTLSVLSNQQMPQKNELVVWLYLSNLQETIYRNFLKLEHVKSLLFGNTTRSPLVELTILKKLCDHPRLLSTEQCANLGLDVSKTLPGSEIQVPSYKNLLEESGKIEFTVRLLEQFQIESLETGKPAHRTLIFSQSLRLLDMVEVAVLEINGEPSRPRKLPKHKILRLDGRLKKLEERNEVLNRFAEDLNYTAMLLTTQVGGVGLTITTADRVVILDPSWNPSIDTQAVDRVYRIGQRSNVVVYRLITCATVEEKIYRRQVFKSSIIRQTMDRAAADRKTDTDCADPYRYFTRQELVELFTLDENPRFSKTQRQLAKIHCSARRKTYPELESHLQFILSMKELVFDISDHDLLFTQVESSADDSDSPMAMTDADVCYAEAQLRLGEAAISLEAAQDFAASKRLQEQAYAAIKPNYNRPAGEIFAPSKADSQKPMFNAPGLGSGFVKASALLTSSQSLKTPTSRSQKFTKIDVSRISSETSGRIDSSSPLSHNSKYGDSLPAKDGKEDSGRIASPCSPAQHAKFEDVSLARGLQTNEREGSESQSQVHSVGNVSRVSGETPSRQTSSTPLVQGLSTEESLRNLSIRSDTKKDSRTSEFDALGAEKLKDVSRLSDAISSPSLLESGVGKGDEFLQSSAVPSERSNLETAGLIDFDLTQTVDDEEIDQSRPLKFLRKSLAMSGIYLGGGESQDNVDEKEKYLEEVIEDSYNEDSYSGDQEEIEREDFPPDSVEIIEDSFAE
nr:DNA excision repair protein ERCC 6 [Hymenolepis microstoma]